MKYFLSRIYVHDILISFTSLHIAQQVVFFFFKSELGVYVTNIFHSRRNTLKPLLCGFTLMEGLPVYLSWQPESNPWNTKSNLAIVFFSPSWLAFLVCVRLVWVKCNGKVNPSLLWDKNWKLIANTEKRCKELKFFRKSLFQHY